MKAVIVDIRKKQAAAMDESGRIVRIHNAGYKIGQQIGLREVKSAGRALTLKRISSGVAAAVLAAVIGTGTAYAVPYGTVTLDGAASVEYTINCFDYVLDVEGTNEEGEALLAEIDETQLRHRRIEAAVGTTVERINLRGNADRDNIEVQISAETKNEDHSKRLREELAHAAKQDQEMTEPRRDEPLENEASERPSPQGQDVMDEDLTHYPEDTLWHKDDSADALPGGNTPVMPGQDLFRHDAFTQNNNDAGGSSTS